MASGLEHLLDEGVISEVLARLQSGKEAEVFVVRFDARIVAAKVYKDRAHRSFKNNSSYKEGRAVHNSRSQRAIDRGSKFGKAAEEDAWKSAEADALYKLHAAEVRVPAPVMFIDGVLLMELVLGADGQPASRLIDTSLSPAEARDAYHDMLTQLVRMLSCDMIHGDLSAYNVLWAAAGPTVIDFPQIVSASHNSSSERFFLRDAENILGHFARIDRSLAARRGDAAEIWRAYLRRDLTPDFVPTGRMPAPQRQPLAAAPRARMHEHPQRNGGSGSGRSQGAPNPQRNGGSGSGRSQGAPNPQRNGGSGSGRSQGAPNPQRNGAPNRPNNSRAFAGQRRSPKTPEVLFARPRPGALPPVTPAAPKPVPQAESAPVSDDSKRFAPGRRPRFR